MSLQSLPFYLTSITYFVLGIWVILNRANRAQYLYGILCITTSFWQGVWAILFSNQIASSLYLCVKIGYTGIVFIPPVFYQFIIQFTERKEGFNWLRAFYLTSFLLSVLIWAGNWFVDGFYEYPWGRAAKAGNIHFVFILLIFIVVIRMIYFLFQAGVYEGSGILKRRQANVVMAALLLYAGGSLDLLSNYGYPIFPLSCIFTGAAFALFTYAIFRYKLLEIKQMAESLDESARRAAASQEMNHLGMTAAFPLVSQGELLGYLLLGEKMSEETYSREDLLLLRIIANQAALAYQRVRYLEMAVRGARTEMLGEIAGGFAHEIKTPLANISLPAELCFLDLTDIEQGKRRIEDALPELKQRMKDIMQQTFKASDKIEAIRQFSKPGQIQLEPVDLRRVMQGSISILDHLLNKAAINFKADIPDNLPKIRGNAKQLEIVFVNLIKNATEAMASANPAGLARNLSLKSSEDGNYVAISVKDTGPGIKRTDIGHLFEAYFTTKGSSGTGIGLFLTHQVVKACGGSIEVQSEEGKGTEFIVRLPKYSSEGRSGAQAA